MSRPPLDFGLYLVTDSVQAGGWQNVAGIVEQAIAGGVTVVQVRDKHADDATFTQLLLSVAEVARPHGVDVVVNDRVHIAARFGFDVHIGQDDMPLHQARELLGSNPRIGLSVGSEAELDAVLDTAIRPDVLGLGPVFATSTKLDAGAPLGITGLQKLARRAAQNSLASVAIGGITSSNINAVRQTTVDGVCVVSAIMSAENPRLAALTLSAHAPQVTSHTPSSFAPSPKEK